MSLLCIYAIVQPSSLYLQQALEATSSEDFEMRVQGTARLAALLDDDESLLNSNEVAEHVTALLEMEASAFETYSQPGPAYPGRRRGFFVEELPELTVRFLRRTAPLSPRFLSAAVRLPHNDSSEFTRLIAKHGAPATQAALTMANSEWSITRINGYSLVAEILRANHSRGIIVPLTLGQRSQLVEQARHGLRDVDLWARKAAIQAVVNAGDKSSIPILMHLMQTDPDDGAERPPAYRSVRRVASEAVQALSK